MHTASAKSPNRSPKNSSNIQQFFDTPLFQLTEMKTVRAVDRIFTQNSIEKVHTIFQKIQQDKRQNTSKLRNTLQKNYDKMLDCSQLLERVEQYGQKIKGIAQEIATHVVEQKSEHLLKDSSHYTIKYNHKKSNKHDVHKQGQYILRVQQKLKRNELLQAMKLIQDYLTKKIDSNLVLSEKQYCSYLITQTIIKLQNTIKRNRLTPKNLIKNIKVFQIFLELQKKQGSIQELTNRLYNKYSHSPQGSLFQLAIMYLKKCNCNQINEKTILHNIAYQVIFQYKISILTNQCSDSQSASFQQYFNDLLTIFRQSQKLKNNGNSSQSKKLSQILKVKIPQIKSDLAKIFITKDAQGQITFKSSLYDKLMRSQKFNSIIEQISTIYCANIATDESALNFFKQLWQNYFVTLIDYCFQEIEPTIYVLSFQKWRANFRQLQLPPQLKKYGVDKSAKQTSQITVKYMKKLDLAVKNLLFALQRSTKQEHLLMKQKITKKTQQIHTKIQQTLTNMTNIGQKQHYQNIFRDYLLIKIISDAFYQKLTQLNANYCMFDNIDNIRLQIQNFPLQNYWQSLQTDQMKILHESSVFQKKLNKLDAFFIGYLQNYSLDNDQHLRKSLTQSVLKILRFISQNLDKQSRNHQILEHTLQSFISKKQKMSIMDQIAMPYCAKKIFACEFKPFIIDQSIFSNFYQYDSLFKKPQSPSSTHKNTVNSYENQDDFQIGDMEQAEEVVKVNNKKSIFNMGSNIVGGFMRKKK